MGSGYDFVAPTRLDKLFTGIAVPAQPRPDWMPQVTNTEIGVDDTFDGEYGRLLERATEFYLKRVASLRGSAARWKRDTVGIPEVRGLAPDATLHS